MAVIYVCLFLALVAFICVARTARSDDKEMMCMLDSSTSDDEVMEVMCRKVMETGKIHVANRQPDGTVIVEAI